MAEKKHEVAFKVLSEEKDYLEIEFPAQDVGFASLIAEKLQKAKQVSFAAAAYDHPLKGNSVLRIRAKDTRKELHKALEEVQEELEQFANLLSKA